MCFLFTNAMSSFIPSYRLDTGYIRKISVSHGNRFYSFFRGPQKLRENFISERSSHILKEQKSDLTGFVDDVSTIMSRRKRQKCQENPPRSKVKADVYDFVTHHHDGPPEIIVGNPISRNPCSNDALKMFYNKLKTM